MSYLEDFQDYIEKRDFKKFLHSWKKFCSSEPIDPQDFMRLLSVIQSSEFAKPLGKYVDLALPLWRGIDDQEDSYKILKTLMDLQTTNSPTLADIAYQALRNKYGEDPKFEERIRKIGIATRENFQGALSKYELLNHLERGNFVYHREGWGNGEVREVSHTKGEVVIEFEKNQGIKNISIDTALNTLIPIDISRFLKNSMAHHKSKEEKKNDPIEVLRKLLKKVGRKTSPPKKIETALTTAVIHNDIDKVIQLKENKEQVLTKNFLGVNCIEIARYLDRAECLEILEPQPKKSFKVRPKDSTELMIFTEQEFNDFFNIHYIKHLKFGNYQLFQEVVKNNLHPFDTNIELTEDMTPEILKDYDGKPEQYKIMAHLYSDKISDGYFVPVTIEWIDDTLRYGAFAERDLKKGEYIGEYTGEIRRYPSWAKDNDYSIIYPSQTRQYYRVDATIEGNELRFFNHSQKPNTYPILSFDRGLVHPTYLAAEDIPKGTQLTWNYGEKYWSKREPPKDL